MLYQSCWNNLVTGLIVPSSLLQLVNSLFQTCSNKFGTSSANTSCQQLVNRLVTTCLQVCSNLCVFTCVVATLLVRMFSSIFQTKELLLLLSDARYSADSDSGSEVFEADSLYTNFSPTCRRGASFAAVSYTWKNNYNRLITIHIT